MNASPSDLRRTLFVSDLDGTLLRPDTTVGGRTRQVVNDLIAAGGLFTYATARSFTRAAPATIGLHLQLPVITYAGAVIVDPISARPRPAELLPVRATHALVRETAQSTEIQPIMYVMHGGRDRVCWLEERTTPFVDGFLAQRRGDPRLLPLRSWEEIDLGQIFFVSVIGAERTAGALKEAVDGELAGCHVVFGEDIYAADEFWLELGSVTGTKAAALGRLRDELGAEQVICFGDNFNDLSMFAVADVSVAVANAAEEVRRSAMQLTGSNADEGVAEWLADFMARVG